MIDDVNWLWPRIMPVAYRVLRSVADAGVE
jgi:hypothetical protein